MIRNARKMAARSWVVSVPCHTVASGVTNRPRCIRSKASRSAGQVCSVRISATRISNRANQHNDLKNDIQPAASLGMQVVQFDPRHDWENADARDVPALRDRLLAVVGLTRTQSAD